MVPDILSSTERGLRKRIDLSGARITLTEKCLVVLVPANRGGRCLRLWLNGRWSITGTPEVGSKSMLLSEGNLVYRRKSILRQPLTRIASMLCVTPAGRGD